MINLACPSCNTKLRAEDKAAGKRATCPNCGTQLVIPTPEAEAPASPDADPGNASVAGRSARATHQQCPTAAPQASSSRPNGNLIACPDCGRQVSIRAAACPNCGSPVEAIASPQHQFGTLTVTRPREDVVRGGFWTPERDAPQAPIYLFLDDEELDMAMPGDCGSCKLPPGTYTLTAQCSTDIMRKASSFIEKSIQVTIVAGQEIQILLTLKTRVLFNRVYGELYLQDVTGSREGPDFSFLD